MRILPELKIYIPHQDAEIPLEFICAVIEHSVMRFQHVIGINGANVEYIL